MRRIATITLGILALAGGLIWMVLGLFFDRARIVWGGLPVSWFLITGGAVAVIGEAVKIIPAKTTVPDAGPEMDSSPDSPEDTPPESQPETETNSGSTEPDEPT